MVSLLDFSSVILNSYLGFYKISGSQLSKVERKKSKKSGEGIEQIRRAQFLDICLMIPGVDLQARSQYLYEMNSR